MSWADRCSFSLFKHAHTHAHTFFSSPAFSCSPIFSGNAHAQRLSSLLREMIGRADISRSAVESFQGSNLRSLPDAERKVTSCTGASFLRFPPVQHFVLVAESSPLPLSRCQRLHRESGRVAGSLAENIAQLAEVVRLLPKAVGAEVPAERRGQTLSIVQVRPVESLFYFTSSVVNLLFSFS